MGSVFDPLPEVCYPIKADYTVISWYIAKKGCSKPTQKWIKNHVIYIILGDPKMTRFETTYLCHLLTKVKTPNHTRPLNYMLYAFVNHPSKRGSKNDPFFGHFWSFLGQKLTPFLTRYTTLFLCVFPHFGPSKGVRNGPGFWPKMGQKPCHFWVKTPKSTKNGTFLRQKGGPKMGPFSDPLFDVFCPFLGTKWCPNWPQNGSKNGSKIGPKTCFFRQKKGHFAIILKTKNAVKWKKGCF